MRKFTHDSALSRSVLFSVLILIFASSSLFAQSSPDDVRLFQSYFYDAPISKKLYAEGGIQFSDYDVFNRLGIGVQGGYPVNEKIEVQASLGYINYSPEGGDGESGISDLGLYGRYNLSTSNKTNISAGGMITLPIGSDKVLENNLNVGGFGAVRHALQSGVLLTGTLGLIFSEETEYLYIGAGAIYTVNDQLNVIGEFGMRSKGDYMMLSGGVDYNLGSGRIRGALGIGLDDGAPDIMIIGGYAITL